MATTGGASRLHFLYEVDQGHRLSAAKNRTDIKPFIKGNSTEGGGGTFRQQK